jgi:hypothetical protein
MKGRSERDIQKRLTLLNLTPLNRVLLEKLSLGYAINYPPFIESGDS